MNQIPVSNLRKGNLIRTEYGILRIYEIVFSDIQVKGKDGRILWAKDIEGIGIGEFNIIAQVGEILVAKVIKNWLYVHELQNWYYWNSGGKEINMEINE